MLGLRMRMMILTMVLFAIVYAIVVMVGTSMGMHSFSLYLFISLAFMGVQFMMGPKIVEWTMRIKYIKEHEAPELFQMTRQMCQQAGLPMPKLCISQMNIPNAFAFGRSIKDGRVCVTKGIMNLLNKEELRAVVGHELAHIKNRDVVTITLLSVIPMICYRIAWHFLFFGRRGRDGHNTALVGVAAFVFYFITNLLVLYASRIREYYADRGSIEMGNKPQALASALYKLVYGSAKSRPEDLKEAEGLKAFFANDPSRARSEFKELSEVDVDRSGDISANELFRLKHQPINISGTDKFMELLSTHPNMLKRIKALAEYKT